MRVLELLTQVRHILQDHDKNYWTDSVLLNHYNDCVRQINSERLEDQTVATMTITSTKSTYDTSGVLRYISAEDNNGLNRPLYPNDGSGEDDSNGIVIEAYNQIRLIDPTIGTILTMKVIAYPSDSNLDSSVRVGDENAIKSYITAKAYEQETDMENFQKSGYFMNKFEEYKKVLINAKSINYRAKNTEVTQAYFY